MIPKSPFTTLFSTSEGLGKVLFWAMVVYGMVSGEIDFMHGLGLLGAEQLGYTGIRQWSKTREKEADVDTEIALEDVAEKVLDRLREDRP